MITFGLPAFAGVALLFFLSQDESIIWKALLSLVLGVSLAFRFIPSTQVHPAMPIVLQTLVAVSLGIYWKVKTR